MPKPGKRTRSRKRVLKTLPGGNRRADYGKKIAGSPRCSLCGQLLPGISNASPLRARKLSGSKKRISRLHGGQVCHNCLKIALKQAARIG